MKTKILSSIPFSLTLDEAMKNAHISDDFQEEFEEVFARCMEIAVPKMAYGVAAVELRENDRVAVDTVEFKSRILYVNMKDVKTVFPYVCTSGREVYEYALSLADDPLIRFWADSISELILRSAMVNATKDMQAEYDTKELFAMSPGSLPDWPMPQQRPLFQLLGDVMGNIGVELTESCLMLPVKSISGLMFESNVHYSNCSMCPRENCPNRRTPFDAALSMERYGLVM